MITFRRIARCAGVVFLAAVSARGAEPAAAARDWFQKTEQTLMDAIGVGDVRVWDAVMDETCVVATEEGEVLDRAQFLKELRPLPAGLAGGIAVKELTVQGFETFAVVRFLADEWETVFGQRLTTRYRVTNTYRRAGPSWKMVASHLSVVTADPPAQRVPTVGWPGLAGDYRLQPDGWTMHVVLKDGRLLAGRDPAALKPLIPMTQDTFVRQGSLGEWLFAVGADGKATHVVNLRKFEPLVWTRVADSGQSKASR